MQLRRNGKILRERFIYLLFCFARSLHYFCTIIIVDNNGKLHSIGP